MPALSPRPAPSAASTPSALLRERVAGDGARPLLTFYDDASGERVELSATTFDNWVAKTANLLQDELGVGAGSTVAVDLPTHWQASVWVHACWAVGAVVDPAATGADVVVAGPNGLPAALDSGAAEVVAVPLRPLGGRWDGPPPSGALDYAAAAPGQGDRFVAWEPPAPAAPALVDSGVLHTHGGLVELARERAAALGLRPGERMLADGRPASLRGALEALLPLVVGGSVVLVRHGAPGTERDRARSAAERVSRDLRR